MNIQRKYSLPNCTLLLEGLSDINPGQAVDVRPILSILVNAECYLSGVEQTLSGGRDFFESLVVAVSGYAQEFLSKIPHAEAHNHELGLVDLQQIDDNLHRLTVYPEQERMTDHNGNHIEPAEIDLTTVQLFDLVEAVDQFFADTQTLPDLVLQLKPLSQTDAGGTILSKQAVPAGVGVSSLAVAALALFLIPPPVVKPPTTQPQKTSSVPSATASPTTDATTSPTPGVTASPVANAITSTPAATANPLNPTPAATANPAANALTATPGLTAVNALNPTESATASPVVNATSPPTTSNLEALINTAPEITDSSKLYDLNRQVYNQINPAWVNRKGLNQSLVYRVGVAADGAILGYKAVNSSASDAASQTPLPNLLYNSATRDASKEPLAQFKVVFTPRGVLETSPWFGYKQKPKVVTPAISDAQTVKNLNQQLKDQIRTNWQGTPRYRRDLIYRVGVNKDGALADYEPINQPAMDNAKEVPLPKLFQASNPNTAAAKTNEPLAQFKVIFKPSGELEVTPWNGYR
jgi:Domain of unknown function (DUF4335)